MEDVMALLARQLASVHADLAPPQLSVIKP
jgi:hypothetical protein